MWVAYIIISQFVIGMVCCGVIFLIWKLTSGRGIKFL